MFDPNQLIDIILFYSESEINTEIRTLTLEQRHPRLTHLTSSELQNKKNLFTYARLFIKSHPQNSTVSLIALMDWFLETTNIKDSEKLAMLCWYTHLNNTLPASFANDEIIELGLAYLTEPHKFAAFLYWLLKNGVTPREIKKGNLLYHYFSYHIIDIHQLQKTYALLENISTPSTLFLKYAETISCEHRGFIDREQEEGQLQSYNIKGGTFLHTESFLARETIVYRKLSTDDFFKGYGAALFNLFDWEWIRTLDFNDESHQSLFIEILNSPSHERMLAELPRYALDGVLKVDTINNMLRLISETGIIKIEALIESEPFFIHSKIMIHNKTLLIHAIEKMITQEKYKTVSHIAFLVILSKWLTENYDLPEEKNKILSLIFELILPYGSTLTDEIIDMIEPVQESLNEYCEAKLMEYQTILFTTISNYMRHRYTKDEIDYQSVELLWSSTLSQVNLFKYLYPELKEKTDYPANKYDLRCGIVWHHFILHNTTSILDEICSDQNDQCRTLQEILLRNTDANLEKLLLNRIALYDSPNQVLLQKFGDGQNIILHAIAQHKSSLFSNAVKIISFEKHELITALLTALECKNVVALSILCQHNLTDATLLDEVTKTILEQPTHLDLSSRCNLLQTLYTHCDKNKLSKNTMRLFFYEAVDNDRDHFVSLLCLQRGCNHLSKYAIAQGAKKAAENENWGLLQLLCGLSDETADDDPVIRKNNIGLYVRVLTERKKTIGFYVLSLGEPLNIINNSGENILHIAAASQSYKTVENLFLLIEMIFSKSEIMALLQKRDNSGKIPRCDGNTPNARQINRYLEHARLRYTNQPSSLTNFFRRHRDNNRDIFDLLNYPMEGREPGSNSPSSR